MLRTTVAGREVEVRARDGAASLDAPPERMTKPGPFHRLVQIYRENERLLGELDTVRSRTRDALTYRSRSGGTAVLADARLAQLRAKRSGLLALLRSNRIEALDILARVDGYDRRN